MTGQITKCPLCADGLGREDHLAYLAILELANNNGRVKASDKNLTDYINKNLSHLNNIQLHFRLETHR